MPMRSSSVPAADFPRRRDIRMRENASRNTLPTLRGNTGFEICIPEAFIRIRRGKNFGDTGAV